MGVHFKCTQPLSSFANVHEWATIVNLAYFCFRMQSFDIQTTSYHRKGLFKLGIGVFHTLGERLQFHSSILFSHARQRRKSLSINTYQIDFDLKQCPHTRSTFLTCLPYPPVLYYRQLAIRQEHPNGRQWQKQTSNPKKHRG